MLETFTQDPLFYPPREIPDVQIAIPPKRTQALEKLKNTARYVFVGPYQVRVLDTTYIHTQRVIKKALLLENLPLSDRMDIADILQLHDVGEGGKDQDYTAVDSKKNPDASRKIKDAELEYARRVLTEQDFQTLLRYESAKPLLEKGPIADTPVDPQAILAKLIDIADNDNLFHLYASHFVRDHGLATWDGSPPESFTFAFPRIVTFLGNLHRLNLDPHYTLVGTGLLQEMIGFAKDQWSTVPKEQTPADLAAVLRLFS